MHNPNDMEDVNTLIKLWYHEACRVFSDRLINMQDRNWFEEQLTNQITQNFSLDYNEISPAEERPVLFADFANDFAMCLELSGPIWPKEWFQYILCGASVSRALVGVAGGATRYV